MPETPPSSSPGWNEPLSPTALSPIARTFRPGRPTHPTSAENEQTSLYLGFSSSLDDHSQNKPAQDLTTARSVITSWATDTHGYSEWKILRVVSGILEQSTFAGVKEQVHDGIFRDFLPPDFPPQDHQKDGSWLLESKSLRFDDIEHCPQGKLHASSIYCDFHDVLEHLSKVQDMEIISFRARKRVDVVSPAATASALQSTKDEDPGSMPEAEEEAEAEAGYLPFSPGLNRKSKTWPHEVKHEVSDMQDDDVDDDGEEQCGAE